MQSMTGFGRGKASFGGHHIGVEISSVNRKNLDIIFSLPRGFAELEPRLRDAIRAVVSRGRLNVAVALHVAGRGALQSGNGKSALREVRVDIDAARRYWQELKKLRQSLKMSEAVTLDNVIRGPGVIVEEEAVFHVEEFWPALCKALGAALKQLVAMRGKEGRELARDLRRRTKRLQAGVRMIGRRAPLVMEQHREALYERARLAGLEIDEHDERLLKEIVFFADRSDISEELTRLASHFEQFGDQLTKEKPVGRTLDFIIQEMNREVNTIGSKANDINICREVVEMKTEIEKLREQVQNIE